MIEVTVGGRTQIAQETEAQAKETDREVGMEREGELRMQFQERDWH